MASACRSIRQRTTILQSCKTQHRARIQQRESMIQPRSSIWPFAFKINQPGKITSRIVKHSSNYSRNVAIEFNVLGYQHPAQSSTPSSWNRLFKQYFPKECLSSRLIPSEATDVALKMLRQRRITSCPNPEIEGNVREFRKREIDLAYDWRLVSRHSVAGNEVSSFLLSHNTSREVSSPIHLGMAVKSL